MEAENDWSSSVSTSSLLSDCELVTAPSEVAPNSSPSSVKERQRSERRGGSLTDQSLEDLCVYTAIGTPPVYRVPNVVHYICGSFSQFETSASRTLSGRDLLPPMTSDCCQTFSAIAAVLLSSLGLVVLMEECWNISTVNYLVYIAAWLHQLTAPLRLRSRPTVADLNSGLLFEQHFPAKIHAGAFVAVLYERSRLEALVSELCQPLRPEGGDVTCGYIIVSGQYTVSIFSLAHNVKKSEAPAWSLYIADSHGTLPWARGKASVSSLALRGKNEIDVDAQESLPLLLFDEGIRHFCDILCALLEDNRRLQRVEVAQHVTPYMTWTPIVRKGGTCVTAKELTSVIDNQWLPDVLRNPRVADERASFGHTHPIKCFWAQSAKVVRKDVARPRIVSNSRGASQTTLDRFLGQKAPRSQEVGECEVIEADPTPANLVPPSRRRR